MGIFKKKNARTDGKTDKNVMQMVTSWGEYFYSWNGRLYDSDIEIGRAHV